MRNFSVIAGMVNLLALYGSLLWSAGDRTGSPAPTILAALTFNMAMGWLYLAATGRNVVGERTWSARPAVLTILFSLLLAGAVLVKSRS